MTRGAALLSRQINHLNMITGTECHFVFNKSKQCLLLALSTSLKSYYIFRVPPNAHALRVFEEWPRAFHGTSVDSVKKILECGDLLMPGISFCNVTDL